MLHVILACLVVALVAAEVTILKEVTTIYDRTAKLRIKGAGFDVDASELIIGIGTMGQDNLVQGVDFGVSKVTDGNGIVLSLLDHKKWLDYTIRVPPVHLILDKVAFKSAPNVNLLPNKQSIVVAQVLQLPTVIANDQIIYRTVTQELRVNVTGLTGAKKVDLYFDPPLKREVDYDVKSVFPITTNQVVLRLHHNGAWRESAGPLVVKGIDTGGGPVEVNGGVSVANVINDLEGHSITVEDTASKQLIYVDDPFVTITGSGFGTENKLSFKNGMMGKGRNYTTVETHATSLKLKLESGSVWRKNGQNLPAYLTLLTVDSGHGHVSVGPINAAKGQRVATVFERPSVLASNTQLFRTHSHSLVLNGNGFPKVLSTPLLDFWPTLQEGLDYTTEVTSSSVITVTLLNAHAWREDAGPLLLKRINTRGDANGWVVLDDLQVANVVADVTGDATGGVEVFPMGEKVYQSLLSETINIIGKGFKEDISFTFEPPLIKDTDYSQSLDSVNKISLSLKDGKMWTKEAGTGPLTVKSVTVGGKTYTLGGSDGIRVAVVLENPKVTADESEYHVSQSKIVYVKGSGFTTSDHTKILIRPSNPDVYKIKSTSDTQIRLQLQGGKQWQSGTDRIPLQVSSIDTGAGAVVFPEPVTIGYIIPDKEGVTCNDSCEFSFDDVCDDGTSTDYSNYYTYYYGDDGLRSHAATDDSYMDYYAVDDAYTVSACLPGTDCTDCGGVDYVKGSRDSSSDNGSSSGGGGDQPVETCTNTCLYARDGVCDDTRGINYCVLGTDCQDCGPVGAMNFTISDDDTWWDDDDNYWNFNDEEFMDQTKGIEHQRSKMRIEPVAEPVPTRAYLEAILLGVAYTIGIVIISSFVLFMMLKGCGYDPGAALRAACNFGEAEGDIELATSQRMVVSG